MTDPDDFAPDWLRDQSIQPLAPRPGTFDRIRRGARRRRIVKAAATSAGALAIVALIGTQQLINFPQPQPGLPAATGIGPDPALTTGPPVTPPTAHTPTPRSSATPSAATARCHTSDLRVTARIPAGGGAAGSSHTNLVFTNRSAHACTLFGYPGVSFVGGEDGTQVNTGFTRSGAAKRSIVVKRNGVAHATLTIANPDNFSAAKCKPVSVRGFRIYPPDETAAVFVSQPQTACSAKGVAVPTVDVIGPGPGAGAGAGG